MIFFANLLSERELFYFVEPFSRRVVCTLTTFELNHWTRFCSLWAYPFEPWLRKINLKNYNVKVDTNNNLCIFKVTWVKKKKKKKRETKCRKELIGMSFGRLYCKRQNKKKGRVWLPVSQSFAFDRLGKRQRAWPVSTSDAGRKLGPPYPCAIVVIPLISLSPIPESTFSIPIPFPLTLNSCINSLSQSVQKGIKPLIQCFVEDEYSACFFFFPEEELPHPETGFFHLQQEVGLRR